MHAGSPIAFSEKNSLTCRGSTLQEAALPLLQQSKGPRCSHCHFSSHSAFADPSAGAAAHERQRMAL